MTSATVDWSVLGRPLPARSLIASLLLGMHPPRQTSARLVRWCAWFEISENAARVALSRMVEGGELRLDDGWYELAGQVRSRQARQDWVLRPELDGWDGQWLLAIAEGGRRSASARGAWRAACLRLRLAELRDGVWGRPDNLPVAAAPGAAWEFVRAGGTLWRGAPEVPPDTADVFDLGRWSERAELLAGRLAAAVAALERAGAAPEPAIVGAFIAGAATLAHLRADPLLPRVLQPGDWPGDRLRAAYAGYQPTFAAAVGRAIDRR